MNKKVSLADRASRMAELAGDLASLAIIEVEAKSLAKEQRSPAKMRLSVRQVDQVVVGSKPAPQPGAGFGVVFGYAAMSAPGRRRHAHRARIGSN